jgi:zinc protease
MRARARSLALLPFAAAALACAGPRPAWEKPPPPIAVGPVVPAERVHRTKLDNGLEVFVLEDHSLPSLEVGLAVPRGAGIESTEEAGIASLVVEVMKRGAGDRDALALARAVDELGATLSVSAGWDSASVSLRGLSEDRGRLFGILADVVRRPRLDPREIARARAEQLAELGQQDDDPGAIVSRTLARTIYPEHRYGLPQDGVPGTVTRLGPDAVREFYGRIFRPGEAIFFAVGDVTPEEAVERARVAFGDWKGGDPVAPGPDPPVRSPPARRVVVVDRPDLGQAQIGLGHDGLSRTDPERIPASLMNTVLGGGGFLSRLLSRVRADEGLTYSVGSGFDLRREPGPFIVRTFTRVPETGRVVGMVLEEIERIRTTRPPTLDELEAAKTLSAGRFVLALETPASIAGALVDLDIYGLPPDSLDTYRERIRAVSLADVARSAQQDLHPDRMAIVVVGPASDLVPLLEPFGRVEVVTLGGRPRPR